ncbi:hypothetical protein [Sinorhizobium medicae]
MSDGDVKPYLVEAFDAGPSGLKGMQALLNTRAAEGYSLVQATPRNTYHWVLIFERRMVEISVDTGPRLDLLEV